MHDQDVIPVQREQALVLFHSRRFPEATALLQEYCPGNPEDGEAWSLLGMLRATSGDLLQAEVCFQRALEAMPGAAGVRNDLGHVLRLLGRFDSAVKEFQRALALRPGYAEAAYNLALAFAQQGESEAAEEAYRQALRDRPVFPEAHNNLANLLRGLGRIGEAIGHYQQAVAARPDFSDAYANLALALENIHRLDEARRAVHHALEDSPDHPVANLVLARINRRCGKLAVARERLEYLQGLPALPPLQAAVLATELGHVLDRSDEPDMAFNAFTQGNRIWKQLLGSVRSGDTGYLERVRRARRTFTAERVANWCGVGGDTGPVPVFLVGFPRSGTTLTEEILGSHPEVITSHEKPIVRRLILELPSSLGRPFRYPQDLDTLNQEEITCLQARYWSLACDMVGDKVQERCFIDKLPLNLVDLGLIRRLFPAARVILVIRDPRDTCLSCYMQTFQPNQAMVAFLDMDRTAELYREVMQLGEHYRNVLGLPWKVVRYEDVVLQAEETVRGLLSFLGLEWNDRVLRHHETARTHYANTPSYQDVTRPLYDSAIGRWRNYRVYLAPVLDELQDAVREYGYDA